MVLRPERELHSAAAVEIRFVSSLTIDDENRLAPAVLRALAALLCAFPIAYTVRIETAGGEVFEHQATTPDADAVAIAGADVNTRPSLRHSRVMPFRS